ncbi:MAG: nucleoside hydrolase [Desulfovibrio sp.]|jgi:inosine-uridine nucleoside N-ribohydrolase|nr:nucleoside hydrolase [Mailhella sp.]
MRLICSLFACLLLFSSAAQAVEQQKEKVLLDTDMVEAFDDGFAMLLLANAPNVDLVGVTTVTGNSWVEDGTALALYQLEVEKRGDVPVAAGLEFPFHPQRHELFELERKSCGMGADAWVGSFAVPKPASWLDAYRAHYHRAPTVTPVPKHAVDFIIDTVRSNPGEITIAAIGPCSNLAMAIRKAPDIVPLIKRVVYMGGAFFKNGNVTPTSEFNWWFDPEAARIAVRTPFKRQMVLGLDVCEKVVFQRDHYDRILRTLDKSPLADMLSSTFVGRSFEANSSFTHYVWDVLVAAVIIDPSLITGYVDMPVDVVDSYGLAYGQSIAYPQIAPPGCQVMRIVTDIDAARFWDLLNDKKYWNSVK